MSVVEDTRAQGRNVVSALLVVAGAAGFVFALASLFLAMGDVMVANGGQCASGGPYQIADGHQCSGSDVAMTLGGFFGMFVAGAVLLLGSGRLASGRAGDLGFLMWAALFGSLGWNFLRYGFEPPGNAGLQWGWIVPGVLFWLMAAPGLIGLPGVVGLKATAGGARSSRWSLLLGLGVALGVVGAVVAY